MDEPARAAVAPLFRRAAGPRVVALGTLDALAARIDEISEEIGVGVEQHARVVVAQPGLIGLHRAVEAEEVAVPAVGVGEDAVALGIALAANLLGPGGCVRDQHGDVAVGLGADFLRALAALGAELRRLALALGLHPLMDLLAVLAGQTGPADAHVDDRDAERTGLV